MSSISILPAELLLYIFEGAVFNNSSRGLLETTWEAPDERFWASGSQWPHPDVASLATRRTIIQVNRTWRKLSWGLYFDYLRIPEAIRGREYASNLIAEVGVSDQERRKGTSRIDIAPTMLEEDNIEVLLQLVEVLNDVRIVSLTPTNCSTVNDSGRDRLYQLLSSRFPQTLRRFAHIIHNPFSNCKSPGRLSVQLDTLDLVISECLNIPWLTPSYATLTSLHIHLAESPLELNDLPALRHLGIHVGPSSPPLDPIGAAVLLQRNGKSLESLHMTAPAAFYGPRGKGWCGAWAHVLPLLLHHAPNVRVVTIPFDGLHTLYNQRLEHLTHIGIESPYAPFIGQPPTNLPYLFSKDRNNLPALKVIRMMNEVNPVRVARRGGESGRFDRWVSARKTCEQLGVRLEDGNGKPIEARFI